MNLILRALENTDAERLSQLANNRDIWDNMRDAMPHPYAIQDANRFIQYANGVDQKAIIRAIIYEDQLSGMIGIHPQEDVYRHAAEIGYWVGEAYWGKGIASRAVQLMVDYTFAKTDIKRIYAGIFSYNKGSMRVLEKCGFTFEGISKNGVLKNDQLHDEHRYALIK